MTKNTVEYSKISEADDCLHRASVHIANNRINGARERIHKARALLQDLLDQEDHKDQVSKEVLINCIVETAVGINGLWGWDTVEDFFNVHFGIEMKTDPLSEVSTRKALAYGICKDVISELLSAEKENFDQNFETVQKRLLNIAARTHKFAVGSDVSFSYNGKTFEGKISDVAWLPARGFVYELAVQSPGWGEMTFDIPERNIKN